MGSYENKEGGKGLCVIIANFTDDLEGYKTDIVNITKFFRNELNFHVIGGYGDDDEDSFRNLTTADFMDILRHTQNLLKTRGTTFDRLFVFVLSHGDESGIDMIKDRPKAAWDQKEGSERQNPQQVSSAAKMDDKFYVKIEDIVKMFTHDEKGVPELKGFPKCFFFQVIQIIFHNYKPINQSQHWFIICIIM